ncbi:MAG: aroC [Firmicutes bacterium]|nr:aroC [Bacillota bacterium]
MLRFLTAGESHGPCLTAIIEGLPSGLPVDLDAINQFLYRRRQGIGRGKRMQIEADTVEILSGVRFGYTLGSPVTLAIHNRDWENWQERMAVTGQFDCTAVTAPRPGHADLAGVLKYGSEDIRDILERASARETAARTAVGALLSQLLAQCGIIIMSTVSEIGGVTVSTEQPEDDPNIRTVVEAAQRRGDTLGGIFAVKAVGAPPGLGSHVHWDRRLDGRLAGALMSIPAIKGVEIGAGFGYSGIPGSMAHDEIFYSSAKGYYRTSNRAGGLEGGMTNGADIWVRAVMKPIPTLMSPLASVDIISHEAITANTERSDVCAVQAAAVVGEAVTAIVLAEVLLEKFGGDHVNDLLAAMKHYRQRIAPEQI